MTLFVSDLHLGHKNIVDLCNRPFKDVDEMDSALIEKWNRKVKKNDLGFYNNNWLYRYRSNY